MKRSVAALLVGVLAFGAAAPAHAVNEKRHTPEKRFANVQPLEHIVRSRSAAIESAGQVPGAAMLLLEALRWRGRTARQLGLPTKLWCADFMNFVLRRAGGRGTHSRAARSFLKYGKRLKSPRVGAIAILSRKGPLNGHVGIVRGTDGRGNPILVSGNSAHRVRQWTYPKRRVLGYVMPPQYVLDDMAAAARRAAAAAVDANAEADSDQ